MKNINKYKIQVTMSVRDVIKKMSESDIEFCVCVSDNDGGIAVLSRKSLWWPLHDLLLNVPEQRVSATSPSPYPVGCTRENITHTRNTKHNTYK